MYSEAVLPSLQIGGAKGEKMLWYYIEGECVHFLCLGNPP